MSEEHEEQDYQVGYGRPPKHSRFRKGQSGNPGGKRRRNVLKERSKEIVLREAYTNSRSS
jgi:hypothetical protein